MQATETFTNRTILAKDIVPPTCRSENEEVATLPHERAVESSSANQLSIPSTTTLCEEVVTTQPADAHYIEPPSDPPVPVGFASQFGLCKKVADAYMLWTSIDLPVSILNPATMQLDQDALQDSKSAIHAYLISHPDRVLACSVDESLIVFDATTPEGITALRDAEKQHAAQPALVFRNGTTEHHFFSRTAGNIPKTANISGVSLKTLGDLILLPPYPGVSVMEPETVSLDLTLVAVPKSFLNAICSLDAPEPQDLADPPKLSEPVVDIPELQLASVPETPVQTSAAPAPPTPVSQLVPPATRMALTRYFIDDLDDLERQAQAQVPILGLIVLAGQATVIYAKHNTGKTLIMFSLIMHAIQNKVIDPEKLVYVNMDDNSTGLIEKARIAQEFGFHTVADGYNGFEAKSFWKAMRQMIETNTARGQVIILDTLKKFVNTMEKKESSEFAKLARKFVMKGGTIVALAHVNKRPGANGKPVYGGTTDILDDFDCGYTIDTIDENPDTCTKVVEFENIKRRGNVPLSACYDFSTETGISYNELLLSVREIAADDMDVLKREQSLVTDATVIAAIEACIREGTNTKMLLAESVAERASISKRQAIRIIEKYTGTDPDLHRWHFVVKDRGAKVFVLLEQPTVQVPALTDSAD